LSCGAPAFRGGLGLEVEADEYAAAVIKIGKRALRKDRVANRPADIMCLWRKELVLKSKKDPGICGRMADPYPDGNSGLKNFHYIFPYFP